MNYYNEYDPFAAQWIRNLIAAGLIPPGVVDTRSIEEVTANELSGFTQCHFFAGVSGWGLALALAGWSPSRPVWTGSCPCQPFSVAGKGLGADDKRHLWPHFRRLIADGKPTVVFGEQVASKDGREWFTGVRADLEVLGFAVGAADLSAAGVPQEETVLLAGADGLREMALNFGPPHIRQRMFWMADAETGGFREYGSASRQDRHAEGGGESRVLAGGNDSIEYPGHGSVRAERGYNAVGSCEDCGVALADGLGLEMQRDALAVQPDQPGAELSGVDSGLVYPSALRRAGLGGRGETGADQPGGLRGGDAYEWIPCGDGKARRIKSGLMPLVNGFPGRVGLVRGYGNAIVPQIAATFIETYMEVAGL